jgi:hypothetical protein
VKQRLVRTASAAALSCTLAVAFGAGISAATPGHGPHHGPHHGGHPHGPTTVTGSTTCTVHNLRLSFSSPLTATPTAADGTVTLRGDVLRGCDNAVQGRAHVHNGHLRGLSGVLPAGTTCAGFLAGSTTPALAGGVVRWTPVGKIAASTGITFPVGTLSTVTDHLQLAYSGGTVVGSYASSAATVAATSRGDVSSLSAACADGLHGVGFSGTITL